MMTFSPTAGSRRYGDRHYPRRGLNLPSIQASLIHSLPDTGLTAAEAPAVEIAISPPPLQNRTVNTA